MLRTGCLWFRGWATAAAAMGRTNSTCWARWSCGREDGKAPEIVIASHATDGKVDRTRPLCAYPEVAKYKGSGSTDDAANFACVKP